MLKFVEKVLKKDDRALLDAHAKDYFDNLLPQLYDVWMDREVLSRLGIDDLMKVPGIKEGIFQQMKEHIKVRN